MQFLNFFQFFQNSEMGFTEKQLLARKAIENFLNFLRISLFLTVLSPIGLQNLTFMFMELLYSSIKNIC